MANAKKKDDSDLLSVMRQRMASSTAAFATSRAIQLEDQKFAIGNSDNNYQWPEYAIETRRGSSGSVDRPTLTVNRLPQHIKQVTNDQRQNPPAGHVIPANDSANADVAQIFDGMIRYIESASEADIAYRTAGEGQVTHGEGYWRILTEYVDEDSFDQEIRIARIRNPFSVYDDPMIQHPCGKDRRFCFITDDMTHEAYEAAYPKATLASTLRDQHPGDPTKEWVTEKTIRVAEYFYIETTTQTLNLWADGSTTVAGSPQDKRTQLVYLTPRRTREAEVRQVKWIKTNGFEELERADWAGKYIPVVRVVGNEDEIEGELEVSGIVRNAKDAVRMVNYWTPLALDTSVPTPTGWTTIGEVRIGDALFDDKGNPCKVVGLSPIYEDRQCFKITFDNNESIVADAEHRWAIEERGVRKTAGHEWNSKTVTTAELFPDEHFIWVTKPLQMPEAVLPLDPYFLGVWLGDGDSDEPQITAGAKDIDEMVSLVEACGYSISNLRPSNTAYRFYVTDIRRHFTTLGLFEGKHIPKEYLRASESQRWALLQGLMDTDGSIDKKWQCSFTTTTPQLRDDFAELLGSLGIKAVSIEKESKERSFPSGNTYLCAVAWQFSFSARQEPVFRLSRKLAIQQSKTEFHPRRTRRHGIVSIEPVASVPVRCLTVDNESHLFLVSHSMIPTHNSQEAEMLALAPKAPFIGYAGQFAGHESKWKTANTHPWPYLEANPLATDGNGNPLPLPMRSQPPEAQVGLIQAKAGAVEDVKATTGQYNAALGMTSNERSGKAINARKMESDTGTYHYIDNLAKAVRFSTEIIIDLIPRIYDTRRVVQIIGIDDEAARVQIDPEQPEAVREQSDEMGNIQKIYNPSIGRYAVRVTTGPNFLTKRQEGAQAMTDIASANPALWATAGDLIAKYQDWPGADAFAERLRRTIDPKLLDKKDPQVSQLEQTVQQQGQMLDQMHQMLKAAQSSLEERELALEAYKVERKADSDDYNAVTNRLKVAPQDAITAEQAQDIVAGTMAAARDAGDLVAPKPVEPQGMPPQGNGGVPV